MKNLGTNVPFSKQKFSMLYYEKRPKKTKILVFVFSLFGKFQNGSF